VDRILAIRDTPPDHLQRTPGPEAILYYLGRDADLAAAGLRLPRSTRTVWQILRQHGRIASPGEHRHTPVERPAPMTAWQLDFKDVSTVPPEPDGKQQHVVEVLNTVLPVEKPSGLKGMGMLSCRKGASHPSLQDGNLRWYPGMSAKGAGNHHPNCPSRPPASAPAAPAQ
jgi:hypothetical protein